MVHRVSPLRGFASGICIGAADLVPGISGGTVALILGIYEQLIDGLRSFDFLKIMRGQFREGVSRVPLKFLGSTIAGIALSVVIFVHVIHAVLSDPVYRPLLYSFFFGLVLASAQLITSRLKSWKVYYIPLAILGGVGAFLLSGNERGFAADPAALSYGWVFFCGVVGICAMLLPGISGGYLLNVLGMYIPVITALSVFFSGLAALRFDWEAFKLLAFLGLGILFGALAFSRAISWALRHYHDVTVAVLVGFMLGALRSVWPFWNDSMTVPTFPGFGDWMLWSSLAACLFGIVLVKFLNHHSTKARAKIADR